MATAIGRRAGMARVLLLLAACCSVARADLNFLEVTDLVGFRTVFEEGDGLPTDHFTLSLMCRKNNRNRIFTMSSDWDLSEYYENVEGTSDLMLDYSSNVFATADVYTNQTGRSEDELLLEWLQPPTRPEATCLFPRRFGTLRMFAASCCIWFSLPHLWAALVPWCLRD